MSYKKGLEIIHVDENSPAYLAGIKTGFFLVSINETIPDDITDYLFESYDSFLELILINSNGLEFKLQIDKEEGEPLGLYFKKRIFNNIKTCKNNCIFCFVNQMPKKMRKSLYIKDEDYRLSFLDGSYMTMASIGDDEFEDIIIKHLSPLYISIHATQEKTRRFLLQNENAKPILPLLKKLAENDILFHTQIVVCPGINDGHILKQSITELLKFKPNILSIALVPVGLTKFRQNLYSLELFDVTGAKKVLDLVKNIKNKMLETSNFFPVWASDEFYIQAHSDIPDYNHYADFSQIENGVGLVRYFVDNFLSAAEQWFSSINKNKKGIVDKIIDKKKRVFLFTGTSFAPILKDCINRAFSKNLNPFIEIRPVINSFFGSTVTVTGLLTYSDIYDNLAELKVHSSFDKNRDLLILPDIVLSSDSLFLDNIPKETALKDGFKFISSIDPHKAFEDIIKALSD